MITARLYRGRLDLGDGSPARQLEVWQGGTAAAAFDGGTQVGTMHSPVLSFTDDDRLRISGTTEAGGGDDVIWEGPDPAQAQGQWPAQRVTWADGDLWTAATVTWTQYGVTVSAAGHPNRRLAGARTEVTGAQRFIVDTTGARFLVASNPRNCGCSGK